MNTVVEKGTRRYQRQPIGFSPSMSCLFVLFSFLFAPPCQPAGRRKSCGQMTQRFHCWRAHLLTRFALSRRKSDGIIPERWATQTGALSLTLCFFCQAIQKCLSFKPKVVYFFFSFEYINFHNMSVALL